MVCPDDKDLTGMTNGTDLMCSSFLYVLRTLGRRKAMRGRMLTSISWLGKVRENSRVNGQWIRIL